jgi:hypothetical protein
VAASIGELAIELREVRVSLEKAISENQKDDDLLEEKVWNFYSKLERLSAIMKLRLSLEDPPHRISIPKSEGSPLAFLDTALNHMKEADDQVNSGNDLSLLRSAQAARNSLRCYLTVKRRARASEARTKIRASRSRQVPSSS